MPTPSQFVLVLSPHPDDESLGCGGTIRLLAERGVHVDVVYMTCGEEGAEMPGLLSDAGRRELADTRMAEARKACSLLGVQEVDFLQGADGKLIEQPHLVEPLRERLNGRRYDRVFCPWPQEKHPDHAATFRLLQQALRGQDAPPQLWLYEVWTPLQPTICVPIDGTIDAKLAAIQAHESQLKCFDYLSAFRGLAAYRSLFSPGARYAEAFIAGETQSFFNVAGV
jgi:LmbE family N-acetylglucosaminyl deacetylase